MTGLRECVETALSCGHGGADDCRRIAGRLVKRADDVRPVQRLRQPTDAEMAHGSLIVDALCTAVRGPRTDAGDATASVQSDEVSSMRVAILLLRRVSSVVVGGSPASGRGEFLVTERDGWQWQPARQAALYWQPWLAAGSLLNLAPLVFA